MISVGIDEWRRSAVFIVNFVLLHIFFHCFYRWLWTGKMFGVLVPCINLVLSETPTAGIP